MRRAAIGMPPLPEWTAPLRARLCLGPSLEADRLKTVGLDLAIETKLAGSRMVTR